MLRTCLLLASVLLLSLAGAQPAPDKWSELMRAGDAVRERREFAKADTLYKEALQIAQKIGPADHRVAVTLGVMASLYEDAGDLSQVETLLKLALAIDTKAKGPDTPAVALRMNDLALYYKKHGRPAEAEPL